MTTPPDAAPNAALPKGEEATLSWLLPVGILAAVWVLAVNFVGQSPLAGWRLTWQHPEAEWHWWYRLHPHLETGAQVAGLDNDRTSESVEFALAALAFGVIAWGYRLEAQKRGQAWQLLRDRLLVVVGISSFFAYFNFGHLHFDNFVHAWDTYHYYMGAKYFPETGYDLLYDCAAVADAESGRREEASKRNITDLRTNIVVPTADVLAHPERCKDHFSPERWDAFKRDINMWRSWVNDVRWRDIHLDHGYNATPVWTIAGMALANGAAKLEPLLTPDIPASVGRNGQRFPSYAEAADATLKGDFGPLNAFFSGMGQQGRLPFRYVAGRHVVLLDLLDPLYLLGTVLLVWWAFGPRAFGIAALILGTNFPNRYLWTGGSFLRHDWLFFLVASVCLLKKDRPFLAGGAIAYSTLLRLFPGFVVLGPVLAAVEYFRVNRRLAPDFKRFVAGGAAATALLLTLSFAFVGGVDSWVRFAQNTSKHANTPLLNHMGLRSVLGYRPSTIAARVRQDGALDAWARWKELRLQGWNQLKPLFAVLMVGALALLYFALRDSKAEQWMAASLAVGLIPFGVELTNYYYCFLMAFAVTHVKRRETGLLLSALCLVTLFIEFAPLPGMSKGLDEQYVAMSVATLIAVVGTWWTFTNWGQEGTLPMEPEPDVFPKQAALAANAPAPKKGKKR